MTETDGLRVGHKTLLKKNDILCVLVSVFILDILLIITYLLSMQFHIHKKNGVVAF